MILVTWEERVVCLRPEQAGVDYIGPVYAKLELSCTLLNWTHCQIKFLLCDYAIHCHATVYVYTTFSACMHNAIYSMYAWCYI